MNLNSKVIAAFDRRPDWFTLTSVVVRVAAKLGGYRLSIDGAIPEAVRRMERDGTLAAIVAVHGVIHPPDRSWIYAFRLDDEGWQIAVNADPEAVAVASPLLREVLAQS